MFARVSDLSSSFVHLSTPPDASPVTIEELESLNLKSEGYRVPIGSASKESLWAVVSKDLGNGASLQVGKHARASEQVLAHFRNVFLAAVIPAILLGVGGGAFLTFKSMAPIRRLAQTMNSIVATGDMQQRAEPIPGRNELNIIVSVFNQLLKRNQRLIESMRTSLDSVAHDLRTPLTRLRNKSERALTESDGNDLNLMREALEGGLEESENLQNMLEDLMALAEAETGVKRLQLELFSLPDLLESVVELYEYVAEDKNITIKTAFPDELGIEADRNLMQRVFGNLIDNAIKYSGNESVVTVTSVVKGDEAEIVIEDQGDGIPLDQLPNIWDRLYRVDSSRTTRGLGLGLSFVRAIVEAHKGAVDVESELSKGSRFVVRLPLKAACGESGG